MSIYFSVDATFADRNHSFSKKFPTCNYVEVDQGQYSVNLKLRPDDPRVAEAKKNGVWTIKVSSGIHYFDDIGFPICKICGWCPIK